MQLIIISFPSEVAALVQICLQGVIIVYTHSLYPYRALVGNIFPLQPSLTILLNFGSFKYLFL